ncbi:hypothetical protein [Nocardiopsis rhodophaea]
MEFHQPGRPEDLPSPHVLWSHGAALAALGVGIRDDWATYAVEDGVLHYDDGGGNEWRLVWVEGGRAVLIGCDHECSDTYDWYPNPIDFFADSPDWMPREWLADYEDREPIGFVYWWDGESWNRVDYPEDVDDDGLGVIVSQISSPEGAVDEIRESLEYAHWKEHTSRVIDERKAESSGRELLRRAMERTVDAEALSSVLGLVAGDRPGVPAALEVAWRAGLTPGTERPRLPAGHGHTADAGCSMASAR